MLCPDDRQEGAKGKDRGQKGIAGYMVSIGQGTPPPLLPERQPPSTPIIFRTKNTEKSRLGLIGKNFGKNLWENVSEGERKAPNLVERGLGVLKYERLVQR